MGIYYYMHTLNLNYYAMKTHKLLAIVLLGTSAIGSNQLLAQSKASGLKGDYFGQVATAEATVFAPNFISAGMYERDIAISPDGNEAYYSLMQGDWNTIMVTKRVNGERVTTTNAPTLDCGIIAI